MTTTTDTDFALLLERALLDEAAIAWFAAASNAPVEAPVAAVAVLEAVVRKYRCLECGYRHEDGVEVTLEEPVAKPGKTVGYWCCDECGSDFWDNVRVVGRDFP